MHSIAALSQAALIGIFCLAGEVLAEEAKGRLTLEEAMRVALKQYPAVAESKERVDAAKEQIGVSKSGYYPQLSFSGNYYYGNAFARSATGTFQTTTPSGVSAPTSFAQKATDFFIYRFSANQLLYDFGKTSGQVDQSTAGYKQAGEDLANTRFPRPWQHVQNCRSSHCGCEERLSATPWSLRWGPYETPASDPAASAIV